MADKKISALTAYTPPLDSDVVPIVDTANTTTKKFTWAVIKATLKTYFDTIYAPLAKGYVVSMISSAFSPGDGASSYFVESSITQTSETGALRFVLPKAGTIKAIYANVYVAGTLSSGEDSALHVRLNGTTDLTISSSVETSSTSQNYSNTSVSQAVAAGDYITAKFVCPTFATNPTNVKISISVYIE